MGMKMKIILLGIPGVPIGIYDYRLTGAYPLKAVGK